MINISPFALNFGNALREGQNYPEFRRAVELLAQNVAEAVRDAPPFEVWPIEDGPPAPPPVSIGLPRL